MGKLKLHYKLLSYICIIFGTILALIELPFCVIGAKLIDMYNNLKYLEESNG